MRGVPARRGSDSPKGESEGKAFPAQDGGLTDLKNRGVNDILIACVDGLKGFPEAIAAIFPQTDVQLCVVHQIRGSMRYVSYKDRREFMSDLKPVYRATTAGNAEIALGALEEKWGGKYPVVLRSWRANWQELSGYFRYTPEIRRLIYTTNMVEGYHRQLRKVTKSKGPFSSDGALEKLVYLAYRNISKKWTMPIADWGPVAQQLSLHFGDRFRIL